MNLSQMQYYKQLYGYSYEKLAELSGIPKGTIQKIFTGVTKSPRYETLQALEQVLKDHNKEYEYADDTEPDYVAETAQPYSVKKQGEYTLEDYYALPDERRVELIDGVFYDMNAPTTTHQIIAFQMCYQIENYIEENGGDCIPYIAPVDVQLDCDDKTMLEPDVIILCDPKKDITRCIYGAPDFLAEVLSKSTRRKDMRIKTAKYASAGVREYWMIDPDNEKVMVYHWGKTEDDLDTIEIYGFQDKIPVSIYDGKLEIDFAKISKKLKH